MATELPIAEESRPDRCETCRFWGEEDPPDEHRVRTADCQRFPPSVFVNIHDNKTGRSSGFTFGGDFPETCHDMWCGEWQAKKLPPAPPKGRPPMNYPEAG